MPKRPKKGGDTVAKTIQTMDTVDTVYTAYRTIRTILAVPALIVLVVFVLIPGILVGILALFQPQMLKVSTGTPLTQVGDYESPPDGTLYVTPNHRLVGTVKLPGTYGMSFIAVPMDGLQPNFDEMQSFFVGDALYCDHLEKDGGYYLLLQERDDVVYRHADILDWYELLWLDCTDGTMTTVDRMEAAGAPVFLESSDGQILLSWQGENSAYINHYDSATRQRTATEPAEVCMSSFSPTPLGNGQYLGFWRDYGGDFQEESLDVEKYLILSNEQGDLLDSYPLDKDYSVTETYMVGDRGYALLRHKDKPQHRLMTMSLDTENGKLVDVHCYTLPKIGGAKYTTYNAFVWKEDEGLQVLFSGPLDWSMGATVLGAATIIDDGDGAPELETYLFQTTDWYGPNCAFQQDGELFYQFSHWGEILFFR